MILWNIFKQKNSFFSEILDKKVQGFNLLNTKLFNRMYWKFRNLNIQLDRIINGNSFF